MRARFGLVVMVVLGLVAGAPTAARAAALIELAPASAWGSAPIHLSAPLGDPRLFVVERSGKVRIVKDGAVLPTPFLTVPNIDATGERGLLSIAFPWDYATTGKFYVFAVIGGAETFIRVLEYKVSADPDVADASTQRVVVQQQLSGATNHNGGQLAFSPIDGYLYVTIGENATPSHAQTPDNLLGKVLRVDPADPDGDGPHTNTPPADNPVWPVPSGHPAFPNGVRNAIWAMGLRNPYRAAFAPDGRLVLGDVGAATIEEINIGSNGANFGWPACEGVCATPGYVNPIHTYANPPSTCAAVIGGIVVRDHSLTGLKGRYLFGDLCELSLHTLDLDAPASPLPVGVSADGGFSFYSFGEDARGCVYVLSGGTVDRLAATAGEPATCSQPLLAAPPAATKPSSPTPDPGTGGQTPNPGGGTTPPGTTPPGSTPTPTTPTPPKKTYRRNCAKDTRISIDAPTGRTRSVKLVRGKRAKTLSFARSKGRLLVDGLPKSGSVKLRISVRVRGGKTKKFDRTYKACKS